MQLTYSRIAAPYRVHELKAVPFLHSKYVRFNPPNRENIRTTPDPLFGELEEGSSDIYPDRNTGMYDLIKLGDKVSKSGSGRGNTRDEAQMLTVRAAPMQHTIPCVGFVIQVRQK
jgi:hypothetical protein